jgi:hypothetical protein
MLLGTANPLGRIGVQPKVHRTIGCRTHVHSLRGVLAGTHETQAARLAALGNLRGIAGEVYRRTRP